MAAYKILLTNFEYGTGLNGSFYDYCRSFYRYLYCPSGTQKKSLGALKRLIEREQPDLSCIVEMGTRQMPALKDDHYAYSDIENKYGANSLLRKLPLFKNRSNAFLSKKKLAFAQHFFKYGTKKLIYEIFLNKNTSLFLAHFSLNRKTRQKQFEEIKALIKDKKRVIVCGDFNIFKGFGELRSLIKKSRLKIANQTTDWTFPACRPTRALDLFIHSDTISVKNLRVAPDQFSDHSAVILEIDL